jgi:hypothetical protein
LRWTIEQYFKVDKKEFSYDNPDLCVPCHQVRVCRSQRAIRNSKALPQWIAFTKDTQQENFFLGTERTACGAKEDSLWGKRGQPVGQKRTGEENLCGVTKVAEDPDNFKVYRTHCRKARKLDLDWV